MIYTEQITLEQASYLQKRIKTGVMPDISASRKDGLGLQPLSIFDINTLYKFQPLCLTRSDYATFIIGNKPVPEGYGYPNKDNPKQYKTLEFAARCENGQWQLDRTAFSGHWINWYNYAFKLTDLARVEALAVVSEMERTEINAAHFADSTDWKAKYSELEADRNTLIKHLQEATASADSLQDRLTDAQNCIAVMEAKYNEIVKAAKYAIDRQQTEQKMLDNYADAKCKSEIAVYEFCNLLKS